MRIVPVTGDLPSLVTPPPPPARHLTEPPPAAATTAVGRPSAAAASGDSASTDRRQRDTPFFDPPLIAQRAALGLPTGYLIADFARSQDLPYAAVAAAVDRELPRQAP